MNAEQTHKNVALTSGHPKGITPPSSQAPKASNAGKETLPKDIPVDASLLRIFLVSLLCLLFSMVGSEAFAGPDVVPPYFYQKTYVPVLRSNAFGIAEICDNGIDDDGDGLIDCADTDCQAAVTVSADTTICSGPVILSAVLDSDLQCDTFAGVIAHSVGNLTNTGASLFVPDHVATYVYEVTDGTYTRLVYDMGTVKPAGSSICVKARTATFGTTSAFTAWILTSGTPQTGSFQNIGSQSFSDTTWQDFCFTLPMANRYFKITDDGGQPFYIDAVGQDCEGNGLVTYQWSTGDFGCTTEVSPLATTTYTVTITPSTGCSVVRDVTVTVSCVEICDNGLDDDGDGLVDCYDPECGCPEICDNGIDDNGNGLIDNDDPQCNQDCYEDGSSCYTVTLLSKVTNGDNTTTYSFEITNGCDKALSHARFEVDNPTDIGSPAIGSTYSGILNNFLIAETTAGSSSPFNAVTFNTIGEGIKNGQSEIFTYTLAAGVNLLDTIRIEAKASDIVHILEVVPDGCVEVCDNGLDDDGDGLIDCADPDCGGPINVMTSGNLTICSGANTIISASASGGVGPYTYAWSHGLGAGPAKSISPTATIAYTVTVTASNGCTNTGQVGITVNQSPAANAGADKTVCQFAPTNLTATASGGTTPYTYNWNNGLGAGSSHVVSPSANTTYTVTVTSANGCAGTDQVVVAVRNCPEICGNGLDDDGDGLSDCADSDCGPTVDLGTNMNSCISDNVTLVATGFGGSGTLSYAWSNGLGSGQVKTVNPAVTTTYSVTVTAANSACTATDQITVTIVPCAENCTNGIDDDGDGLVDCDDPDCVTVAAPALADDGYTTCPGLPYSNRVTYNDGNLQNPVFSIAAQPANGTVSIDDTGKFTFMPFGTDCYTDVFVYEVCNLTSGCCSQAQVTMNFGDVTAPVLTNVPADLTIGCDDAVPPPPTITAFDQCPGIYIEVNETTSQQFQGACGSYTITRTWTATDFCGNATTASQKLTVVDQTKPEIFQVYTLENGKRIVAGVSRRVTHDWKYVPFPITFSGTPMVFTTVVTNNDLSAITARMRNPYSQGFELRLYEQEASDGKHQPEDVAWIAIEPGTNAGDFALEAGRWENIDEATASKAFSILFGNTPGLITAMQSTNDTDPASLRLASLTNGSVDLFVQEEISADAEIDHELEHVGYLAFVPGVNLQNKAGKEFGETGRMNLTNAWSTVSLANSYTKPVVVFGGISNHETDGVNVRVRNVTPNSFEVRLQEWDYLDGNHAVESVSWMVMEGGIPGNLGYYCSGSASDLQVGVNVFAMDNCDSQVAFGYDETGSQQANGMLTIRTWMAIDDCGNTNIVSRYDTCATAAVQVKAQLFGAIMNNGGGANMRDDLRAASLVPLWEPYSKLPAFPHIVDHSPPAGTGGNGGNGNGTPASATLPPNAATATYRTIADGDWASPATWQGGLVPPTGNITNKTISIEHQVTLPSGDIYLKSGSKLWVTNGGLTLGNGYIYTQSAHLIMANSTLQITGGDLSMWSGSGSVILENCDVTLSHNFVNWSGLRKMKNVCMTVGGDFINNFSVDSLTNVTATIHGDYSNEFGGQSYLHNSKFRLTTGNFTNYVSSVIMGDSAVIWTEMAGILNLGTWSAPVVQYCSSGSATGLGAFLPIAEDCSGMADFFNGGSCLLPITPVTGGGGTGADPVPSPAEIAGPGTIDPILLTVTNEQAVVDWVVVELRNADDEKEIVDYATAVILRNGDIVSEDGNPVIQFLTSSEGWYYVTLRHRNHLGLMTNEPVFLSILDAPLLDFSDPAFEVRGGNLAARNNNGKLAMWAGDFNEDGRVIYQGPYNDVFFLFSRVMADSGNTDFLANYIVPGYDLHDLNLDGKVIYQGPNNDRAAVLYHSVLAHPNNAGYLANYIVQGLLP